MNGGPVTITHPDVIRYFMTITEASQLVLQAKAFGKGGDVFVLDMGDPLKIVDLTTRMEHLGGLEVHSDHVPYSTTHIDFVGLRPGEKLYEEFRFSNNAVGTGHPLCLRAQEAELPWKSCRSR